jgi:hypothetical protein
MTAAQPPPVAAVSDRATSGTKLTDIMLQDEITRYMNKTEPTAKKPGTKQQFTDNQA